MTLQAPFSSALSKSRLLAILGLLFTIEILAIILPPFSRASTEMLKNPLIFLKTHSSEIHNIHSQEDALQLFLQSNPSFIDQLAGQRPAAKSPAKLHLPSHIQKAIMRLMAAMKTVETVHDLSNVNMALGVAEPIEISPPLAHNFTWMADTELFTRLTRLNRLQERLTSFQSLSEPPLDDMDQGYRQFEASVNEQFPITMVPADSWITICEEYGVEGIRQKLQGFQTGLSASEDSNTSLQSRKTDYAPHFIRTQLLPMLQSYITQEARTVQLQAYEIIFTEIPDLTQWQQQEQERTMLARVCGSWLWTLHNHLNHQDHKLTVNFYPPGEPIPPDQPTPNTVTVSGDTVYVEWIFGQGKQEDSLLLSNRDTIMEGTFKNSLGPYGSISGKRLTVCKP